MSHIFRIFNPTNLLKYNNVARRMICRSEPIPDYIVRIAIPMDYDRVLQFMADTYFREEPTIKSIGGLCNEPDPLLLHIMMKHIRAGSTIIALNPDECIVGAAINIANHESSVDMLEQEATICATPEVRDLLRFYSFCSREADLWNQYQIEVIYECAYLAVSPEHRGRGIAKRLIEESWNLARDLAHRLFRIDCSSRYTAQIAENFSWKCMYSIPYRRYFTEGNFVFKCVEEPHTEMKIYVDRLNNYSSFYPPSRKSK